MDHNRKEKLPLTERVEEAVEKVLPKRTGGGRKPAQKKEIAPQKLKLLITIVPRNKGEFFTDLLQSFEVNLQYSAVGGGTAGSDILHLMGLESNEKRVIFSPRHFAARKCPSSWTKIDPPKLGENGLGRGGFSCRETRKGARRGQ